MNLILLQPTELDGEGTVRLTDARGAHIATVLNAVPGQHVRIGLVDGPFGTGTVTAVEPSRVSMRCEFEAATPSRPRLDLLLALPRPKVMRRLWSQLAALGVGQVILTNAARVERDYFGAHVVDPAVLHAAPDRGAAAGARYAAASGVDPSTPEGAGRGRSGRAVPGRRPRGGAAGPRRHAARVLAGGGPARALLAVGPEGGWTEFELDLLARHGFRAVGMGPRTLRSDTATIALLTLAHQALASRNALYDQRLTTNDQRAHGSTG